MKRTCVMALLCMLSFIPSAQALTLPELRQQASLGWHQSYQVKGQDIIVDISPLIPDASQLPVLEVSPMPPIPDALFRQEVPHWKNPGDGRNEPGSLVISAQGESLSQTPAKNHDFPKHMLSLNDLDWHQAHAEDNPATLREADGFFQGKLKSLFGLQAEAVLYRAEALDRPRPINPKTYTFTSDIPQPGTTGSYRLIYRQRLRGVPVLYPQQSRVWYAAPDNYSSLAFELLLESGLTQQDLSLCGLDQIYERLGGLIEKGRVQAISSLELGYVVFGSPQDQRVAMPYWLARGLRQTRHRGQAHQLPLTLLIHPQTAEACILEDEKGPQFINAVPEIRP